MLQLKQLVIRGDKGDGIPNILSADDVFVSGGRQKQITEVKLIAWLNQDPKEFCTEDMLVKYNRNELLIDLTRIPDSLKTSILNTYDSAEGKTKQVFMTYMMKYRLKNLIDVLDEF
jgi:hypothetical protein